MKHFISLLMLLCIGTAFSQTEHPKTTIKTFDIKNYGEHEAFARVAISKLEEIINSKVFEDTIPKMRMTQKRGSSKGEILQKIKLAKELRGNSNEDYVIDLRARTMTLEEDGQRWMDNCKLNSRAGTIGKEADSSGYTITCFERIELWAQNKDYGSLAGHYMHEYLHNLGFRHRWPFKSKTVVYKIGYLVRDLINQNNQQ